MHDHRHTRGMSGQNSANRWDGRSRGGLARMIGLLAVAVALASCSLLTEEASYRFRMSVEAETPNGTRTGASVLQVNASKNIALTAHEHQGGAAVQGEAVILELPDGPVFVLLTDRSRNANGPIWLAVQVTKAFDPSVNASDAGDFLASVREIDDSDARVAILPREDWPLMVRFRDISDPMTVELVNPEEIGVKRILLTTSRDPLTRGIDALLRWLPATRGGIITKRSPSRASGLASKFFNTEPKSR